MEVISSKGVLIIKNISREGPGLLEEVLREYGIEYTVIDLSKSKVSFSI